MITINPHIRALVVDQDPETGLFLAHALRQSMPSITVNVPAQTQIHVEELIFCNWLEEQVRQLRSHVIIIRSELLNHNEASYNTISKMLYPARCIVLTRNRVSHDQLLFAFFSGVIPFYFSKNLSSVKLSSLTTLITRLYSTYHQEDSKPRVDIVELAKRKISNAQMSYVEILEIIEQLFSGWESVKIEPLETTPTLPQAPRPRSVIFVVSSAERVPVVLKIGNSAKIKKEWFGYERFIAGRIIGLRNARLEKHKSLWTLGGAIYSMIGTEEEEVPFPFSEYYRISSEDNIINALRYLFKIVLKKLYKSKQVIETCLFEQYNDIWFHSRNELRCPSLIDKLQYLDHTSDYLQFDGIESRLVNPLAWIKQIENCKDGCYSDMRVAITHGDLHADNILVDEQGRCSLIDFERSGYGPRLQDFVELESDIVNRLLDLPEDNYLLFFELTKVLVKPRKPSDMDDLKKDPSNLHKNTSISKALSVIYELRRYAHDIFDYDDFREYLWGLLLNSLFLVTILDGDSQRERRNRALIYASVLCHRLDNWRGFRPPPWPPAEWTIKTYAEKTNPREFSHGHALLVGAGGDLPVTADDATALQRILVDPTRCAYPPGQVRLLTEERAGRQAILDGLDWLTERVRADAEATVVVYFSGHGVRWSESYLLPHGYDLADLPATAISGAEFTARLHAMRPRKLLVILDCCHAGALSDVKLPGLVKEPLPPELEAVLQGGSGRVVIASSRRDEKSYTGSPYSVFTQALCEALAGQGSAEHDGYAYVADVALYVGRVVPQRTDGKQHPVLKLEQADNFAIAYYAGGAKEPLAGPVLPPPAATAGVAPAIVRSKLQEQTHHEFVAFCQDNFPDVARDLVPEQNQATKINILIDHCQRKPGEWARLVGLLFGAG